MDINGDLVASMVVTVTAIAALLWRFETRISGVETRLGDRITDLSDRVSRVEGRLESFATKDDVARIEGNVARIEGLLEGYFMQASKKDET